MSWEQWCLGVVAGVGEPLNDVSVDTHWAWSQAETAPYDLMRWNNPQNTTEKWPGSRDSGAQPGLHDVQIYRTIQDGIDATVWTLINEPYYPAIVANLRAGLPRQQWGAYSTAGAELHAWGTGTNWLQATYGPAPDNLGGFDMATADQIYTELRGDGQFSKLDMILKRLGMTSADVIDQPLVVSSVDLGPVLAAIADLKAHPAADSSVLAIVTRMENALKTA